MQAGDPPAAAPWVANSSHYSTPSQPPPIELKLGIPALHSISEHDVKLVFAYLQTSSDEAQRASLRLSELQGAGTRVLFHGVAARQPDRLQSSRTQHLTRKEPARQFRSVPRSLVRVAKIATHGGDF